MHDFSFPLLLSSTTLWMLSSFQGVFYFPFSSFVSLLTIVFVWFWVDSLRREDERRPGEKRTWLRRECEMKASEYVMVSFCLRETQIIFSPRLDRKKTWARRATWKSFLKILRKSILKVKIESFKTKFSRKKKSHETFKSCCPRFFSCRQKKFRRWGTEKKPEINNRPRKTQNAPLAVVEKTPAILSLLFAPRLKERRIDTVKLLMESAIKFECVNLRMNEWMNGQGYESLFLIMISPNRSKTILRTFSAKYFLANSRLISQLRVSWHLTDTPEGKASRRNINRNHRNIGKHQ